ncbi:MAG TPA: DUF2062 domain-containing protein [Desulfobacteraceae bacterium]|nr:DUF2062 domain-containing protein [Desulfobacteraceae bacterium]
MRFNPLRTIRYYALKFIRLRGNPRSLAMGTAVGIFIGISPTIPFHTIAIVGVTLLMRVSTVSALISGVAVSNPLTMVPQYYLCWFTGNLIFPGRLSWERIKEVLLAVTRQSFMDSMHTLGSLSFDAFLVMLTGGLVIGIPAAAAGYFISLRFFTGIREKRRKKHLLD